MREIVDFAERTVQMDKTKGFDFERLTTSGEVDCACGQKHSTDMKILAAGRGIIEEVPAALEKLNVRRPMVASGPFSFEAVGKKVCGILENAKIAHSVFVFEKTGTKKLQPNEEAVAKIIEHFDPRCDVLLCVGSGSVGDVCKAAATELKVPQLTVGSAPSMDGYTSASASLELHNTKTSVSVNAPVGVICDVELMAQAPMRLLWAGLGDMAAKPCSLCEWEMASVILGEHYCPYTVDLVKQSYERSFSGAPGIPERSLDSVQAVIEGLLLSGVCMSYVHSSRPASGLEHYFSHCWEMMDIARGKEYDLHGIYVGIGAVLTLHIFRKLRQLHPFMAQRRTSLRLKRRSGKTTGKTACSGWTGFWKTGISLSESWKKRRSPRNWRAYSEAPVCRQRRAKSVSAPMTRRMLLYAPEIPETSISQAP